jgi:hypothetical protein
LVSHLISPHSALSVRHAILAKNKAGLCKDGFKTLKNPLLSIYLINFQTISDHQQAGGMRMAPGRGRGHLCWEPLIFKNNFLISVLGVEMPP